MSTCVAVWSSSDDRPTDTCRRRARMSRRVPIRLGRAAMAGGVLLCLAHLTTVEPAHAPQKPVVASKSGEAATLDWHMHCDKTAQEPDRQIFDTLLRRNIKTLQLEGNLAES